jgi:predicted RNA-binding Zn ribbon-like protein
VDAAALVGLGDHPALDFLNSTAQGTVELLTGGEAYLRWMELAGMISAGEASDVRRVFSPVDLDRAARDAVALREWLRPMVARWASGDLAVPDDEDVARLNAVLAAARDYSALNRDSGTLTVVKRRTWPSSAALLALPAAAAADLLACGERSLTRHCEGHDCTLWFYDRTKAHRRRWCSMALCGNREKARTHRARQASPPA